MPREAIMVCAAPAHPHDSIRLVYQLDRVSDRWAQILFRRLTMKRIISFNLNDHTLVVFADSRGGMNRQFAPLVDIIYWITPSVIISISLSSGKSAAHRHVDRSYLPGIEELRVCARALQSGQLPRHN